MNKGLKAWVIETKYRIQLQQAYRKSSDTELIVAKEELLKEIKRRKKKK